MRGAFPTPSAIMSVGSQDAETLDVVSVKVLSPFIPV